MMGCTPQRNRILGQIKWPRLSDRRNKGCFLPAVGIPLVQGPLCFPVLILVQKVLMIERANQCCSERQRKVLKDQRREGKQRVTTTRAGTAKGTEGIRRKELALQQQ